MQVLWLWLIIFTILSHFFTSSLFFIYFFKSLLSRWSWERSFYLLSIQALYIFNLLRCILSLKMQNPSFWVLHVSCLFFLFLCLLAAVFSWFCCFPFLISYPILPYTHQKLFFLQSSVFKIALKEGFFLFVISCWMSPLMCFLYFACPNEN